MFNINNLDNVIDSRDIVKRIEELEYYTLVTQDIEPHETEELTVLKSLVEELDNGTSGDKAEEGITLIRDSYFKEWLLDDLEEIGILPKDLANGVVIDYEATFDNFRVDYSTIEIKGDIYWYL